MLTNGCWRTMGMSSIRGVRRIRFNGLKLNFGSTSLPKNKSGPTTPSCKPADGHKANFLDTPIQKPSTPIGIAARQAPVYLQESGDRRPKPLKFDARCAKIAFTEVRLSSRIQSVPLIVLINCFSSERRSPQGSTRTALTARGH